MRNWLLAAMVVALVATGAQASDGPPSIPNVPAQPLKAQVRRISDALRFLGQPLAPQRQAQLDAALRMDDEVKAATAIQEALDGAVLAHINVNPESRVKVERGAAEARLNQQGWSIFLVKVHNEAGVTARLRASSPNAAAVYLRSSSRAEPTQKISEAEVQERWMDIQTFDKQPLIAELSGLVAEYRLIEIYSRDAGKREATLAFDVGQGTQDVGFRNELPVLFESNPAVRVKLSILDADGSPTTGQLTIRDANGRVYPALTRRLAPDFFFHDQIYRHHGEDVLLPPGEFQVSYTRGPEYQILHRTIDVPNEETHHEAFELKRWIKLADLGWYSGDHHVHAAGCAHYEAPTEGVTPEDMMRHILGEDLNVGCVLSWGPCWYHQKQFFEGDVHKLSTRDNIMRYDVEVSGFPSQHAGHLCLLRLKEDDYPGTERIEQWPTWNLPILQWGKQQGGVVGFSHSGWGLQVASQELPNLQMPKFDGIGANEFIVDVVHDACDFISAVDTPIIWELNIWYQTLNCGYTSRISGETDFPCIYGQRVGLGRSYTKLPIGQELNFDSWVFGIRDGRSYCCDGLSHLPDFQVNGLGVGEKGTDGRASFLSIDSGQSLQITGRAAALLGETPDENIRSRRLDEQPYWHVERARIDDTRKTRVELIVNGQAVDQTEIEADGSLRDLRFEYKPERSCWVALRIFPSCHTNPVFVEVDGKPIRASKQSAQWCLDAVDVCWNAKEPQIRNEEKEDARQAYEVARQAYRRILAESYDDAR